MSGSDRLAIKVQQTVTEQIAEHSGAIKTAVIGAGGTGTSVLLQNFNQAMAGLAATVTLVYICLQIYRWFRPRKD